MLKLTQKEADMERIKCAVIGTGIFGEIHCVTYTEYGRAELAKICDLNEERAKYIAEKYQTTYTLDYREIAENKEISIVSVATPDYAHKDIVIEMLKSGKNVLVEKPMATKVEDAEEMVEVARKSGKILRIDFHNRFNPLFTLTKEKVESGEFGEIMMIYTRLSDKISVPVEWFNWSSKSGPHWFLFPHIVDLVCWFMKKLPIKVYGKATRKVLKEKGIDTYDVVSAILDFGSSYAVVETSWIIPENWPNLVEFTFNLQASKGMVSINPAEKDFFIMGSDEKKYIDSPFYHGYTPVYNHIYGFAPLSIKYFVDCVYEGKKPFIKPEDGLNNVKVIASIMKSVEEAREIEI